MALNGFILTDPDNLQIAKQINNTTWQYCQVNDNYEEGKFLKEKFEHCPKQMLETLSENDLNYPKLFYNETIDFNDISDSDVMDISNEYGLGKQNLSENEFIQLVIEGYFEQYITTEF